MAQEQHVRVLIIGYGSIGQRHRSVLESMGCEVAVLSSRDIDHPRVFKDLSDALKQWQPSYIVVANRTSEHHKTVQSLSNLGFAGNLLIEKPLFHQSTNFPSNTFSKVLVGYNLRFHSLLKQLKNYLDGREVVSTIIHTGQHLSSWRAGSPYRESYSSKSEEGGGVLRDLSHEIDYTTWLFGPWTALTSLGGKFSALDISSEDVFSILMKTNRCPLVSIHLNYVDRPGKRHITVNTTEETFEVDLVNNTFSVDGEIEEISFDRNETYAAQHREMLESELRRGCSIEEGLQTIRTIECIERANREAIWVTA